MVKLNQGRIQKVILIERIQAISYVLARAIFVTSVTVYDIFIVKTCMTLTLKHSLGQGKM